MVIIIGSITSYNQLLLSCCFCCAITLCHRRHCLLQIPPCLMTFDLHQAPYFFLPFLYPCWERSECGCLQRIFFFNIDQMVLYPTLLKCFQPRSAQYRCSGVLLQLILDLSFSVLANLPTLS